MRARFAEDPHYLGEERVHAGAHVERRHRHRNKPLSECQQRRNTRIARTRARVEHVCGAIDQMGGKLLRTIGQARANFAMMMPESRPSDARNGPNRRRRRRFEARTGQR